MKGGREGGREGGQARTYHSRWESPGHMSYDAAGACPARPSNPAFGQYPPRGPSFPVTCALACERVDLGRHSAPHSTPRSDKPGPTDP